MPDAEREFFGSRKVAALALAALVAYCGIVEGWLAHVLSGGMALAAHFAIAIGLAIWSRWSSVARVDLRLPLLLSVTVAGLGPMGAAGTLVTIVLSRWYARDAVPFEEWYQTLFPENRKYSVSELFGGADAAEPVASLSVSAFADILALGNLQQKQLLIALISSKFRPAFGPLLKKALTDSHNAVRVQAATAMNRIENSMLASTLELTRKVHEEPGNIEALRALARHYDEHIFSGILDPQREKEIRKQALAAYQQCLAAEPDDIASRLAVGRLQLRGKNYAEAAGSLEQVMQVGASGTRVSLWYMECLFHLGRFTALRQLAGREQYEPESAGDYPAAALEAVRLWAGELAEAQPVGNKVGV